AVQQPEGEEPGRLRQHLAVHGPRPVRPSREVGRGDHGGCPGSGEGRAGGQRLGGEPGGRGGGQAQGTGEGPEAVGPGTSLRNEKTRGLRPRVFVSTGPGPGGQSALDGADPARLLALATLRDFELDPLVLGQGLEARTLDFAEMREEVVTAAVGGDEAEAL